MLNFFTKLLRWPSKRDNNFSPLIAIVWKSIFWPFMVFGFVVAFVSILFAHGPGEALRWWAKAT